MGFTSTLVDSKAGSAARSTWAAGFGGANGGPRPSYKGLRTPLGSIQGVAEILGCPSSHVRSLSILVEGGVPT